MKRAVLTVVFLFAFFDGFSGYPVIRRTTEGGLFGYYNYTHRAVVPYINDEGKTANGVVIDCCGAGLTRCPKAIPRLDPPVAGEPDEVDATYANDLVEYADVQMEAGVMQGSRSVTVRVQGESFYRKYVLTWVTSNDGVTVTEVNRSNINMN